MAFHLREENLPDDAKLGLLWFYPHSDTSQKRSGIASKVLDYVLKDASKKELDVVFAPLTNTEARDFFLSRGFNGNYPDLYVVL